jgi:hypothetical protein
MTLILYFRLILTSIFQNMVQYYMKDTNKGYDRILFYCPKVVANDGFTVSLQINNANYCESINGYRELGHTMLDVDFEFPNMNEELMFKYSEMWKDYIYDDDGNELPVDKSNFDVTNKVGSIPISVMEEVFVKHGGIDWEKTISVEVFNSFTKD